MFFGHNLIKSTTPYSLSSGVAAGLGDTQLSAVLDMGESQGALFTVQLGTVAAGGTGTIQLQSSEDNGVTDAYANIAATAQAFTSTNSGHAFVLDLSRPQKRYHQVAITRGGTGDTTIQSVTAFKYHVGVAPESPGTNVDGVLETTNV